MEEIMKRKIIGFGLLMACLYGVSGCATVKPYQREFLADRIMDPRSTLREEAADRKWLSTREGALGGSLGAGGGCACN
jgi:hypothetical protein